MKRSRTWKDRITDRYFSTPEAGRLAKIIGRLLCRIRHKWRGRCWIIGENVRLLRVCQRPGCREVQELLNADFDAPWIWRKIKL